MARCGIKDFYAPVNREEAVGLECIDDRGYAVARQSIKLAAGPYGLAKDIQAAGYVDLGSDVLHMPLGETAKIVTKGLAVHNIDAGTHNECAAELGTVAIAQQILENPEQVQAGAIEIARGDITDEEYEQFAQYYQQLLNGHYQGAEAETASMAGGHDHRGIERHELAFDEHVSPYLIANHQDGMVFATQRAYAAGVPHYNADMWAVPRLAREASVAFPVDPDKVLAATAIRHAGISRLLPNQQSETGKGVELRIVA